MKKNTMVVNTKLSIVDYVTLVNEIIWEYFDVNGNYQPQIGIINVMRLFYNLCVKQSKFDNKHPHNVIDAMDIDEIITDDEFVREFNMAMQDCHGFGLTFGNAYVNAMEVVENKKHTISNIIDEIERGLKKLTDNINPILSNGNIDRLAAVFNSAKDGNIPVDSIVDAYKKSEANKDALKQVGADVKKD